MFKGVFTAIVTPFREDKIDYEAYANLVEKQISAGVDGIVPCGTTGESPTLSYEEHEELVRTTVKIVNKRVLVIAGTGSNSTKEAIELTEKACQDGVDGILSVNPYYNKPTQEGLYKHFSRIAEVSNVPIMLYNIPSRTGVNLLPETIQKLSLNPKISSIKEASGDLSQMSKIIQLCGEKFTLLSGDDTLTLPILAIGGSGVVSVVSNLFPKTVVSLVRAFQKGDLQEARRLHYVLYPVFTLSFIETNPIPIKAALSWFGLIPAELRLPLTPLSPSSAREEYKKVIQRLKEEGYE